MECPICKNKLGFNCGTCIECGYNYLNGKFEHIRVYVDDLKKYCSVGYFRRIDRRT